jgi:hypothetical protein
VGLPVGWSRSPSVNQRAAAETPSAMGLADAELIGFIVS